VLAARALDAARRADGRCAVTTPRDRGVAADDAEEDPGSPALVAALAKVAELQNENDDLTERFIRRGVELEQARTRRNALAEAEEAASLAVHETRQAEMDAQRARGLYEELRGEYRKLAEERDRLLRESVRAEEAEHQLNEAQNIAHFNGAERDRLKDECDRLLEALVGEKELRQSQVERLHIAIECLVADEVISAGRARELHGLSVEEQRELWRRHPNDLYIGGKS